MYEWKSFCMDLACRQGIETSERRTDPPRGSEILCGKLKNWSWSNLSPVWSDPRICLQNRRFAIALHTGEQDHYKLQVKVQQDHESGRPFIVDSAVTHCNLLVYISLQIVFGISSYVCTYPLKTTIAGRKFEERKGFYILGFNDHEMICSLIQTIC